MSASNSSVLFLSWCFINFFNYNYRDVFILIYI